jgi:mannosylfructose-phosphate synthase
MGAHKARSLFTWTGIAQQLIAAVEHHGIVDPAVAAMEENEWDEPGNDGD